MIFCWFWMGFTNMWRLRNFRIASVWKRNILQKKSVHFGQGQKFHSSFSRKKLENGANPDACCGSQGIVMKMNHTSLEALRIKFKHTFYRIEKYANTEKKSCVRWDILFRCWRQNTGWTDDHMSTDVSLKHMWRGSVVHSCQALSVLCWCW